MAILIKNVTALLMDEAGTVLPNAYVAVEGTKIASVGSERPEGSFEEIDGGGNVLLPGLVNAHTHIPMTLMRGFGGGCDLHTWLTQYIFPTEAKLDGRTVRAGSGLALAELISNGVTCIADMYMFCREIIEEIVSAGISANVARGITQFSDDFRFETDPGCRETRELYETWHGYHDGQILIDGCIHGEYTSSAKLWQPMADYARDKGIGMHVHVSETQSEHEACKARHGGRTPIQILDEYGVWDSGRSLAAHCVWTTPEDWAIMKKKHVSAVNNPASNLKLGSGVAPTPAMKQAGVNVALGTDGVSSNNNHDMFEEMKLAAIVPCGVQLDPLVMGPMDALRMATCDGARALGRNTGRIAPGAVADLILVDFHHPNLIPCHSAADNLVYSARGSDVVMNMARGKVIYKNGTFFTLDLERIRREVDSYALPLLFG